LRCEVLNVPLWRGIAQTRSVFVPGGGLMDVDSAYNLIKIDTPIFTPLGSAEPLPPSKGD